MVMLAASTPRAIAGGAAAADELIQRVVAHTSRSGVATTAIREMRAGTRSGKHQAWMEVETTMSPSEGFAWRVLGEGGSERTRNKVLRQLLETEDETWRDGTWDAASLTPANYVFEAMPDDGTQARLRLRPRRADAKLVDGTLTVRADGSPLRVEGTLAKSPSFWVRSVTVVRRYEQFDGVTLPVSLETLADVKLVGQSILTVRYRYSEVDGRALRAARSASLAFGPSAEILALHETRARR